MSTSQTHGGESVVPEVLEDESGETWWAVGHIDPLRMVLGVVVNQMCNVGADEALSLLIERPTRYTSDRPHWTESDARHAASALVGSVAHVWMVEDPNNDEVMHSAEPTDEGAQAFTRLSL